MDSWTLDAASAQCFYCLRVCTRGLVQLRPLTPPSVWHASIILPITSNSQSEATNTKPDCNQCKFPQLHFGGHALTTASHS